MCKTDAPHCPVHPDVMLVPPHDPFPGVLALIPAAAECHICKDAFVETLRAYKPTPWAGNLAI